MLLGKLGDCVDDDISGLLDLFLINAQWRSESNNISMSVLGKKSVLFQFKAHLPCIIFCKKSFGVLSKFISKYLLLLMTIAQKSPFPLTRETTSFGSVFSLFIKSSPILAEFSTSFSS